jgi:hypothetical protein
MTTDATALRRRFAALALAVLFLLQSAAQASTGCITFTLGGRCACAAMSSGSQSGAERGDAQAAHEAAHVRSCCARAETTEPAAPKGPALTRETGCHCALAPTPHSSAITPTSSANDQEAQARSAFAQWIARAQAATLRHSEVAARPPPNRALAASPPRHAHCAIAFQRLAQRGVLGFLSDICTALL